jgi:hypothetical protein
MKFSYKDNVKIISGFYKGYKCEIISFIKRKTFSGFLWLNEHISYEYMMWIDNNLVWVEEKDLELINESK